jgi:hypothetical protein
MAYRLAVATRTPGNCLRSYSADPARLAATSRDFRPWLKTVELSRCNQNTRTEDARSESLRQFSSYAVSSACSHASATRYAISEQRRRGGDRGPSLVLPWRIPVEVRPTRIA